jgi:uncharacterized membrane protein YbaN (DUF454 family)
VVPMLVFGGIVLIAIAYHFRSRSQLQRQLRASTYLRELLESFALDSRFSAVARERAIRVIATASSLNLVGLVPRSKESLRNVATYMMILTDERANPGQDHHESARRTRYQLEGALRTLGHCPTKHSSTVNEFVRLTKESIDDLYQL